MSAVRPARHPAGRARLPVRITGSPTVGALRLLTPLGWGTLALGVVAMVLAARLHWQEFTQLGVVALALVALGLLWQFGLSRPSIDVSLRPARLTAGGSATAVLTVRAGLLPMLYPKLVVPVGVAGAAASALRLPFLAPHAQHVEEVLLTALPRGVHVVGPVVHERSDPVGMTRRRIAAGPSRELHVFPRTVDLSVLASGLTNDLDGSASQQLAMSDLAFHALREYVPGDDLRHVHWRSSAKAGALLVRQYHETRHGHVTVLVDSALDAYGHAADFELAVSAATSIALRSARDDLDTHLTCGSYTAHGREPEAMLHVACRFVAGADDYLEHAGRAAATVRRTGLLVQVSGARRDLRRLDEAAARFGKGADRIVVRADPSGEASIRHAESMRELTVPDLARLGEVLSCGRR